MSKVGVGAAVKAVEVPPLGDKKEKYARDSRFIDDAESRCPFWSSAVKTSSENEALHFDGEKRVSYH